MQLTPVSVSGTVGVAVAADGTSKTLYGFTLQASAANATIKIREGLTSAGSLVYFARVMSAQTRMFVKDFEKPMKFTRGLHVTVIGTGATAYLELE